MSEKITLPRLFLTMENGIITKWYKNKGDKVAEGEPLFSIEAEKASQDVESPASGILAQIFIDEGGMAEVGADIAVIKGENENYVETVIEIKPEIKNIDTNLKTAETYESLKDDNLNTLRMTPKARAMAKEMGIDFKDLSTKYGNSRITEKEVSEYSSNASKSFEEKEDIKISGFKKIKISPLRKSIAKKMVLSLEKAAQLTNGMEADMTDMLEIMKKLKSEGRKASFIACIIKACANALKEYPEINCKYLDESEEIILEENINIGFAVDVLDGLLVPVIKNADKKDVFQISKEVAELVAKAKSSEIKTEEMQGGTFTVSNVGMYQISYFTPIINYPEAAILGIGAAKLEPVYDSENADPRIRSIAMLNLSYDHRIIDGVPASKFLLLVKKNIEDIKNIIS